MTRLRILASRVKGLFRAGQLDGDLREQIASHLDEAADEYMRLGLSPEDARRAALRSFGGVTRAEEAWRDARSFVSLDHVRRDVRHAGRSLRRSAGFSLVVVMVLAIATGAVTSVFALLNTVVLRPLPFPAPDRLVVIRHSAPGLGLEHVGLSSGVYFHYAEHARSFESLATYEERVLLNLRLPGEGTERIHVSYASAALFKVLRTTPALGRVFTAEDGRPGFMNMKWQIPVLLSHAFWVSHFGADPNIVGRVLTVNDNPREVVGVLPAGFAFPSADIQMWMLVEPPVRTANFASRLDLKTVGRMRPGVTPASAQAELAQVLRGIEGRYPDATPQRMAEIQLAPIVTPLKTFVIGDVGQVIWLLFGGMAVLLVVACANTGSLFLVRAEQRAREMAVRRALGAHGPHLARLLFTEALLLTGAAALIGLVLAHGILLTVVAVVPFQLPRTTEIGLDGMACLFSAAVAVLVAIFYGMLSIRRRSEPLTLGLLGGGQWATGRRVGLWGPDALLVLQVALALTLMAGSALMVKTYRNLVHRELGFTPADLLTVEIGLPSRKAGQHVRIYQEIVEHVRQLPNVELASAASFVPLTASRHVFPVEAGAAPVVFKFVTPGFFQTMGTPILDGDRFVGGDVLTGPSPVLVSAALARRLYPGERAIGRTVRRLNEDGSVVDLGGIAVPPFTIAGLVGDVRELALRETPAEIVYIPVIDPPVERSIVPTSMRLVVRTRVPPMSMAAGVRAAIAEADQDVSVGRIQTMDAIVGTARSREAVVGALLLLAAGLSLLLGAIGIYASVAQVARRRTREIAIRMALGANRGDVVRMVTTGTVRAVSIGAVSGLALALPAARLLDSLLFGVEAHDPIVFVAVTASLISAAAVAALLAARHAARVPPLVALRGD